LLSVPPSAAYRDAIWEAIPDPCVPAHAALRELFLLERVGRERERLGRAVRVLDVGCGDGWFAAALARTGAEVVGLDASAEAVRRALRRHPHADLRVVDCELPLPLSDSSFDVVWAGEAIEHVADTAGWLSELRRVLRSGGLLLLSTPDHGPLARLRAGLSRAAFERHFDPRSDHLRFYTRRALYDLLAAFRFEEVELRGAGGLPGARAVLLASGRRSRF
jgi:2-polyprenyl-6-hydroxyphenyl methylase/3-demethylubiquinone-9 3-methyltransferase